MFRGYKHYVLSLLAHFRTKPKETKGLPPHALNEVFDFIQFIKEKKLKQNGDDNFKSNLELELSLLDKKELTHLEEEFKDYKELYPREI